MSDHLIDKTVLASLYYFDSKGKPDGRRTLHGTIMAADEHGIEVRLSTGAKFLFPPHVESLLVAPRGTYTDYDTEREFIDPDFLASYKLYDEGNAPIEWVWKPNLDFTAPPVKDS